MKYLICHIKLLILVLMLVAFTEAKLLYLSLNNNVGLSATLLT